MGHKVHVFRIICFHRTLTILGSLAMVQEEKGRC